MNIIKRYPLTFAFIGLFMFVWVARTSATAYAKYLGKGNAQTSDVTHVTPFTGTFTNIYYDAKDPQNPRRVDNGGFAVRSDGARVQMYYRPSSKGTKPTVMRVVTDIANSKRIHVDPFSESITTYNLKPKQVSSLSAPPTECAGQEAGQLLGYDVVKSTFTQQQGMGPAIDKIVRTTWSAPKLNCLALKTEAIYYKAGAIVQRDLTTFTDVKMGEPDPSLFLIPDTYLERSPSQAMTEAARRAPEDSHLACPTGCAATHTRLDDVYFKSKN